MSYHLAQLNIARAVADLDSPVMADFMNNLDRINALAEESPGFVWRLQTEEGNATALRPFDDDRMIVNLSTWESVAELKDFAYRTEHVEYFKRRREWFEPMDVYAVLWWVPEGHEPTVEEAKERLQLLRDSGPSPKAFTFAHQFDPE